MGHSSRSGSSPVFVGSEPTIVEVGAGIADPMARVFHEVYENLAPIFGYETRKETNVAWENVPAANRALMVATCAVVYQWVAEQTTPRFIVRGDGDVEGIR